MTTVDVDVKILIVSFRMNHITMDDQSKKATKMHLSLLHSKVCNQEEIPH